MRQLGLSYEERLQISGIDNFLKRQLHDDLIMTFCLVNDNYGKLCDIFSLNSDNRLRVHKYKLKEHFKCKYILCNRVFDVRNRLPVEMINANTINVIKNRLKLFAYYDYLVSGVIGYCNMLVFVTNCI